MSKPVNPFAARREEVQREVLVPPFPADLTHYDDGSWECSAESFSRMQRSFKRFGFELDYSWSFDALYARFSFILRSASLVSSLDLGWVEERQVPEMIAYLRAVAARDDVQVARLLPGALKLEAHRLSPAPDTEAVGAASLIRPTEGSGPRQGQLYLVQT